MAKNLPEGVPEENVYDSIHWTIYAVIAAYAGSLYLIINAG